MPDKAVKNDIESNAIKLSAPSTIVMAPYDSQPIHHGRVILGAQQHSGVFRNFFLLTGLSVRSLYVYMQRNLLMTQFWFTKRSSLKSANTLFNIKILPVAQVNVVALRARFLSNL